MKKTKYSEEVILYDNMPTLNISVFAIPFSERY